MLASQRKEYLLKVLQTQGQIVAKDVSRELELSEDTIRRDLRELAAAAGCSACTAAHCPLHPRSWISLAASRSPPMRKSRSAAPLRR